MLTQKRWKVPKQFLIRGHVLSLNSLQWSPISQQYAERDWLTGL